MNQLYLERRYILPMENDKLTKKMTIAKKNQSGQSFIEFILLLAGISIISFSFMKGINSNTAQKWKRVSEIILNNGAPPDSAGYKNLQLR